MSGRHEHHHVSFPPAEHAAGRAGRWFERRLHAAFASLLHAWLGSPPQVLDLRPTAAFCVQKWWRRHLLTATGVAAGSVLVIKTDVSGGMAPNEGKCSEDEQGQELYIPMNNTVSLAELPVVGYEASAVSSTGEGGAHGPSVQSAQGDELYIPMNCTASFGGGACVAQGLPHRTGACDCKWVGGHVLGHLRSQSSCAVKAGSIASPQCASPHAVHLLHLPQPQ